MDLQTQSKILYISGECQTGYEDFKVKTNSSLITSTTTALDCQPINHCLNETSCHANATCQFLGPDQFSCTCHQGYAGNGTHCSRKYFQNLSRIFEFFEQFDLTLKDMCCCKTFFVI